VVCFGMFVMNNGALMAVKKLYIYACAQHVAGAQGWRFEIQREESR
jgi:hypothetical protein